MTRAQHRLRSRTGAERGWLRTRLTLRTVPFVFSVYPRTKHGAPSAFLHGVNAGAPWPACAELQVPSSLKRISIAKRSPCRFFHSQSESFVAVSALNTKFTQVMMG
jgi:hypothetical protein